MGELSMKLLDIISLLLFDIPMFLWASIKIASGKGSIFDYIFVVTSVLMVLILVHRKRKDK